MGNLAPETTEVDNTSTQAPTEETAPVAANPAGRALLSLMWASVGLLVVALLGAAYILVSAMGSSTTVATGVSVAGLDIGGLDSAAAITAIERDLAERNATQISVSYGDSSWPVTAGDLASVDPQQALSDALAVRNTAALSDRLAHDFFGEPLNATVLYDYTVDETAVSALAEDIAATLDTDAVDARLTVEGDHIKWIDGTPGITVNTDATAAEIRKGVGRAFTTQRANAGAGTGTTNATGALAVPDEVEVVASTVAQGKTAKDLGERAILVDLSAKTLTLYERGDAVKMWRVATGSPGFPTPTGEFTIVQKRYMPTWGNPGSDWAVNMPSFIPPGPTNPLGLRALNLSVSGIRIHGTSNLASIGTAASHGCVRMANANIVKLYDMVDVGTTVFIVR